LLGVAPQAWGYFSSPRAETFEVYRLGAGGWSRLDAPIAAAANLFGLRRTTVNHGAEFRNIVSQVGNRWTETALTAEQIPDAPDHVVVEDYAREPHLCGDVLLIARPPVPWAWARSPTRPALATKFVRLDVRC
jgi:antimicrobial peptide system SdpA family protein